MKLATVRLADGPFPDRGTVAVRIGDGAVGELGVPDVGALLRQPGWRVRAQAARGPAHPLTQIRYTPLVSSPGKIVCAGRVPGLAALAVARRGARAEEDAHG